MQTISLSELESGGHSAIREIQLAYIKEYSQVNLQWIFKTNDLEVARLLAEKILMLSLLDDVTAIFDQRGWEKCLLDHGAELQGHRVVWRKDASDEQQQKVQSRLRSHVARRSADA